MSRKVLIVDDSFAIRHAVRSWLESAGEWEVCGEAENGKVAIELACRLHPDVIILDLSMPVMNGFDAARVLSKLTPSPAIVLFTAHEGENLLSCVGIFGIKAVIFKGDDHALEHLRASLAQVFYEGPSLPEVESPPAFPAWPAR